MRCPRRRRDSQDPGRKQEYNVAPWRCGGSCRQQIKTGAPHAKCCSHCSSLVSPAAARPVAAPVSNVASQNPADRRRARMGAIISYCGGVVAVQKQYTKHRLWCGSNEIISSLSQEPVTADWR